MPDIVNIFKRGAASFLVGLSLMGLAGCATGPYGTTAEIYVRDPGISDEVGYDQYFDMLGDHKLVGRKNDIYIEKIDGTESRQLTHSPNHAKTAFFCDDGKYITYLEWNGPYIGYPTGGDYFIIDSKSDDSTKKAISGAEAMDRADKDKKGIKTHNENQEEE